MKLLHGIAVIVLSAATLAGCAERPQELVGTGGNYRGKPDTAPWMAERTVFSVGQHEKGDRDGWEKALRARADNQNEYLRAR